jgi:hypothetical protein
VTVNDNSQILVLATVTEKFSAPNVTDEILSAGKFIVVDYPNALYLSLVTPTVSNTYGNFNLQYVYIDRDPIEVIS